MTRPSTAADDRRRRRRSARLARLVAATALGATTAVGFVGATPDPATAAQPRRGPLTFLGVLQPYESDPRLANGNPRPMLVDTRHNIGFAGSTNGLVAYDLVRLRPVSSPLQSVTGDVLTTAIDEANQRLFVASGISGVTTSALCTEPQRLTVVDYSTVTAGGRRTLRTSSAPIECLAGQQFVGAAAAYDAASNKLYIVGTAALDFARKASPGVYDNLGQATYIRQVDATTLKTDWQWDGRSIGCGQMQSTGSGRSFIDRVGNRVVTYCHDMYLPRNNPRGVQGFVVNIELDASNMPVTLGGPAIAPRDPASALPAGVGSLLSQVTVPGGEQLVVLNARVVKTPALPGGVSLLTDRANGKLLLVTDNEFNGNAVWVFDLPSQRFVGVITGGVSRQPMGNTTVGLDAVRGRTYVLTESGVLVASVRTSPLPSGQLVPVLQNTAREAWFAAEGMGVAPKLRRIFVPTRGQRGWAVFQDNIPDPVQPVAPDPDRLTSGLPEAEGTTEVQRSGAALASGAHVVNTGGINRVIDQYDPECSTPGIRSFLESRGFGPCLSHRIFAAGHREFSLASSGLSVGTSSGAIANADALHFPATDTATDNDFRRSGLGPDGTRGTDGKGFPIPGSQCGDFGSGAKTDVQPTGAEGLPWSAVSSSSVVCDGNVVTATARAATAAATIAAPQQFALSAAKLSSHVTSSKTDAGQVTAATGVAEGVSLGPVSIAKVSTVATTIAKGTKDSASTSLQRTWCGISIDGAPAQPGCRSTEEVEASGVLSQINYALAGKAHVTIPGASRQATPGGYQAVVTKDPALVGADSSVNDDESVTVPAMQAVIYNDGFQGRSRLVVQLGNARGESRYGIVPVTQFNGGGGNNDKPPDIPTLPSFDPPVVSTHNPATSIATAVEPEPAATPAIPFDPGYDELIELGYAAAIVESTPIDDAGPGGWRGLADIPRRLLQGALELLVNNPREFALLFVMWSLLAAPAYLGIRRRSFERAMAAV